MAKRSRRMNPDDARDLGRDIDDVVHGSGSAIDAVYEEYKEVDREVANLEAIKENLEADEQKVPGKLRLRLAEAKLQRRELDSRIAQYGRVMLRRIKERMEIIKASPGASFNRSGIGSVDRAIFKVAQKAKDRGADIRTDIGRIMGAVLTLEQDSGIVIRKPGKKIDEVSQRKAEEAELYANLIKQWRKVHRHAKKDPRVQEDIDWVTMQIRGLDLKFRRGESIRRGIERVAKRIHDIHNRTKPRKILKSYADAKKGVGDFVLVIKEYSQKTVTAAGVDRLQRELETFSRQFTPTAKAEWEKTDRRQFATDISNLRKALEAIRPGRKRKKNPCIGLHFHGKDTDDLMKALEESAERQQRQVKGNPKYRAVTLTPGAVESTIDMMWRAGRHDATFYERLKGMGIPRKVAKAIVMEEASVRGSESAGFFIDYEGKTYQVMGGRGSNPGKKPKKGNPSRAAIAGGEVVAFDSQTIANVSDRNLERAYRLQRKFLQRAIKEDDEMAQAVSRANISLMLEEAEGRGVRLREGNPTRKKASKKKAKKKAAKKKAAKKKAAKKKATRKAKPEWQRLIDRCQKLWDTYCEKPTKKNLRVVLAHIEKMGESTSSKVKKERAACLRIANKEAKRLKLK